MISRSESLGQALAYAVRCQVVAFAVFWLALLAPITCQYHGLLLDWRRMMQVHEHHDHPTDGSCSQPMLTEDSVSADIPTCLHVMQGHQTAPDVTLLMSLFDVMIPAGFVVQPPAQGALLPSPDAARPRQRAFPPPDQPPRSA
jgi:hypothetical protein